MTDETTKPITAEEEAEAQLLAQLACRVGPSDPREAVLRAREILGEARRQVCEQRGHDNMTTRSS